MFQLHVYKQFSCSFCSSLTSHVRLSLALAKLVLRQARGFCRTDPPSPDLRLARSLSPLLRSSSSEPASRDASAKNRQPDIIFEAVHGRAQSMPFCLLVVQGLVCFGFSRFEHDSLFWLDLAHLIPAFLPLFWFKAYNQNSRRRRRRQDQSDGRGGGGVFPSPRVSSLLLLASGVILGLAAGLGAVPRLTDAVLATSTTSSLDR